MKISWLNDVQAPYREPMFSEIASLVDFEAFFFCAEERAHRWRWRPHDGYRSSVVPAWPLPVPGPVARRLGDQVGILRPGSVDRVLDGVDAMVTQVWWQPANLQAIVACRRRDIPYFVYAESTLDSRSVGSGPADRLRSWVFRNAAGVIVPGRAAAEAAALNGTPAERIVESVNSIDMDLYFDEVRRLRRSVEDSAVHRYAFIGRLIELKNVHSLIEAFARLDGDPILEIAGDGVEEGHLRGLAREFGVADRIRFLGYLDEAGVLALLARARTLVLPSTYEVFGYVALEAHIAGLQVVLSDLTGISANLAGRGGVWIVPPSVDGLHTALMDARAKWRGWFDDLDVDFASPRRVAADIVSAVDAAVSPDRRLPRGRLIRGV